MLRVHTAFDKASTTVIDQDRGAQC